MIEAMKLALAYIEANAETRDEHEIADGLRQAIAEEEKQEPVAWAMLHDNGQFIDAIHPEEHARVEGGYTHPLYTRPQPETEYEPDDLTIAYLSGFYDGKKKREWAGLTDADIDEGLLRSDYALQTAHAWRAGVVFAMTKLKEKNT